MNKKRRIQISIEWQDGSPNAIVAAELTNIIELELSQVDLALAQLKNESEECVYQAYFGNYKNSTQKNN